MSHKEIKGVKGRRHPNSSILCTCDKCQEFFKESICCAKCPKQTNLHCSYHDIKVNPTGLCEHFPKEKEVESKT